MQLKWKMYRLQLTQKKKAGSLYHLISKATEVKNIKTEWHNKDRQIKGA